MKLKKLLSFLLSAVVSLGLFSFLYLLNFNSIKNSKKRTVSEITRLDSSDIDQESEVIEQQKPQDLSDFDEDFSELLSGMSEGIAGSGLGLKFESEVGKKSKVSQSVDQKPKLVVKKEVPFPPRALSKGLEGFVHLRVLVDEKGQVVETAVVESQPKGLFEKSAQMGVSHWTYQPALKKGEPVATWIEQKIVFKQG